MVQHGMQAPMLRKIVMLSRFVPLSVSLILLVSLLQHDEFLPTFNRDNVTLVHTDGKGIKQITEKGVVFEGHEYELDVLVYATGFETSSTFTSRTGFEFTGEHGRKLGEEWISSGTRTLWGIHCNGYPNLFVLGGTQVGFRE